jgi:hypothetical protein
MEVQVARDGELGLENQGIGARGGAPTACPDLPAEVLWPRKTRADRAAYNAPAHTAAWVFAENCTIDAGRLGAEVNTAGRIGA